MSSCGSREVDTIFILEWSALGGLAAGLVFLRGATNPRRVAAAIFVYVVGDHAAFNYTVLGAHGIGTAVAGAFNSLRNLLSVMPVAALIVAWRLDCRQSCTGSARDILALRHQIERFTATVRKVEFRQTEFIGRLVADWLRQPTNAMVLLLILPSLLWVGLGGFPQMAWVQSLACDQGGVDCGAATRGSRSRLDGVATRKRHRIVAASRDRCGSGRRSHAHAEAVFGLRGIPLREPLVCLQAWPAFQRRHTF